MNHEQAERIIALLESIDQKLADIGIAVTSDRRDALRPYLGGTPDGAGVLNSPPLRRPFWWSP